MRSLLRIATFNAENFSLLLRGITTRQELEALTEAEYQAMNPSIYNPNKDRDKIAEIARMIRRGRYDVVGLCEVGGMETLDAFNRLYLGGRYEAVLHEENSRRGIFVGALVRRDRFPEFRAQLVAGSFARNLLKLNLGPAGGGIEIFVVHLKSQHGADRGLEHRIREIKMLSSIVGTTKTIVMGDFNGIAIRGEAQFEYLPFLDLPFVDALEAMGLPADSRRTHYYFDPAPRFTQLDYLFCTVDLKVRHARAIEGLIPLNAHQRSLLPSDHLMLEATLELRSPWWRRLLGACRT